MLPHFWQRVEARKYSASAQCMMLHLAGFLFGWHKTEAKISYSILERFSGLSRPTVIKACKELVDGGLITHRVENNISVFGVVIDEDKELEKIQKHVNKELNTGKDSLLEDTLNESQEIITSQNSLLVETPTSKDSLLASGKRILPIKELPFKKKSLAKEKLDASFLDKISFNFERGQFENTDELNEFVVKEYLERIRHFGYDAQKIYDDACETIVRRRGTRHEVKKPGIWLCNLFKDASYGNVYKYGHTSEAEKRNFEVNYRFFCSLESYEDMRIEGRFLIYKNREFSFYSSPETFRAFLFRG